MRKSRSPLVDTFRYFCGCKKMAGEERMMSLVVVLMRWPVVPAMQRDTMTVRYAAPCRISIELLYCTGRSYMGFAGRIAKKEKR